VIFACGLIDAAWILPVTNTRKMTKAAGPFFFSLRKRNAAIKNTAKHCGKMLFKFIFHLNVVGDKLIPAFY
jgi:hypothetical protein